MFKTKMASNAGSNSASNENLDYPEILSRERLIEILSQRCFANEEIQGLEKHQLVNLFYKFVTPLPQRTVQLKRTKRVPSGANETTTRRKRR